MKKFDWFDVLFYLVWVSFTVVMILVFVRLVVEKRNARTCRLCGYADTIQWNRVWLCIGYRDGVAVIEPLEKAAERCGGERLQ